MPIMDCARECYVSPSVRLSGTYSTFPLVSCSHISGRLEAPARSLYKHVWESHFRAAIFVLLFFGAFVTTGGRTKERASARTHGRMDAHGHTSERKDRQRSAWTDASRSNGRANARRTEQMDTRTSERTYGRTHGAESRVDAGINGDEQVN